MHGFVTSPATIGTINSVLFGAIGACLLILLGVPGMGPAVGAVLVAAAVFAAHAAHQLRSWETGRRGWRPRFPTPPSE